MPLHVSSTMCSSSGGQNCSSAQKKKTSMSNCIKFIWNAHSPLANYVLIFIELYFSDFRPITCFSVMIPDAV